MKLAPLPASLPSTVPFVGPEAQERALGRPFAARLGANESPFGPSPAAIEAMREAAAEGWMYGDPEVHDLRAAIAAHHGVAMESVVAGEGIDGLLGSLVRLLVAPGDPVVTSAGAYPTFAYHATGYGAALRRVPYRDDHEDLDALAAAAIETGARLVYLANPDNPMGTWHDAEAIADLLRALPADCVLCLDEAYADLAPPEAIPALDAQDDRVIRMRTFSKAHGLAGLRVGYAIAHPELIGAFDRVRLHFGLGRVAQAGALAALGDAGWVAEVSARVAQSRDAIGGHRGDRGARGAAVGGELRGGRLRPRRGFRERGAARARVARRVRADAGRRAAGPLHPRLLRDAGGHGRAAHRAARRAGGGAGVRGRADDYTGAFLGATWLLGLTGLVLLWGTWGYVTALGACVLAYEGIGWGTRRRAAREAEWDSRVDAAVERGRRR